MFTYVQLNTFCTVMRVRTITAAAHALGLSQPAVSQQIGKLEETLGLTLFYRIKGQLEPTVDAYALLEEGERTLRMMDRFANAAEDLRQPSHGLLRVAASGDAAQTIVAEVVSAIRAQNTDVRFELMSDNPVRVTELITARKADVGVSRWAVEQAGCRVEFLYSTPVVAVLPPDHFLSERPVIRPQDLHDVPVVLVCRRPESKLRFMQVFREAGARLTVCAETHSAAVALALVARGVGVLLYDQAFVADPSEAIVTRPFEPRIERQQVVITPAGVTNSPLCALFIKEFSRRAVELATGRGRRSSCPHPSDPVWSASPS